MAFHQALIDTPPGVTLTDLTLWWEGAAYNGGQVAAIARSPLGPSPTEHLLAQYQNAEFPPNRISVPINELKPDHYAMPADRRGQARTFGARLLRRPAARRPASNQTPRWRRSTPIATRRPRGREHRRIATPRWRAPPMALESGSGKRRYRCSRGTDARCEVSGPGSTVQRS
jgi:hypothetical protein